MKRKYILSNFRTEKIFSPWKLLITPMNFLILWFFRLFPLFVKSLMFNSYCKCLKIEVQSLSLSILHWSHFSKDYRGQPEYSPCHFSLSRDVTWVELCLFNYINTDKMSLAKEFIFQQFVSKPCAFRAICRRTRRHASQGDDIALSNNTVSFLF